MMGAKRRKPVPNHRRPAITKNSTSILTEILGTVLAGLIFAAAMWTSAFGMMGGFDDQEAIVMAEVIEDAR